ncbi:MAG: RNA 2',3'-cyclic phosphodiesterase [Desulfobacteraceae bacterium]|nr:RNA 2',3'-cyclic phosphodiesterase [Desulfobacteraceae bacterium]
MSEKNTQKGRTQAQTDDFVRAFIAVSLPGEVTAALADLQARLRKSGLKMKYTAPENIHLTLKFLGPVPASAVKAVSAATADAVSGFSRMCIDARGLGVFPGIRRPRVMWTGIGGQTQELACLQQTVEEKMAELEFEREHREFTGHLTLGRFKAKPDPAGVADAIEQFGDFCAGPFEIQSVQLFESTLTPKGPVYRVISGHGLDADPMV